MINDYYQEPERSSPFGYYLVLLLAIITSYIITNHDHYYINFQKCFLIIIACCNKISKMKKRTL
jgi:hypothetical protein